MPMLSQLERVACPEPGGQFFLQLKTDKGDQNHEI